MSNTAEFVLELRTEEIPAAYLAPAVEALREGIVRGLGELGVEAGLLHTGATPRRLLVWGEDVPLSRPRQAEMKTGPSWKAAFDADGNPTRAAIGFAAGCGVAVGALQKVSAPKGEYVGALQETGGESTASLLTRVIPAAVGRLSWPKSMRWAGHDFRFPRPLRGILMLLGGEPIPVGVGPVSSGTTTVGHRLAPEPFAPTSGEALFAGLRQRFVLTDPEERRKQVVEGATRLAEEAGGRLWEDESLLETVVYLTEWPRPVLGSFEEDFLVLPGDFLATIMIHHQKFFPVRGPGNSLLPRFIGVSNLPGDDQGEVRTGFERVLRARLSDGRFFWDEDGKSPLHSRVPELARVMWFQGAGSLLDKTQRIGRLTRWMGEILCPGKEEAVARASLLCKTDLLTQMVGEFPELQGRVGQVYAERDGEEKDVSNALFEQYLPRGAGDSLAESGVGICLALADKVDTLAACFARGQIPTGSADPYGLRRAALGVLRTLQERRVALSLSELVGRALQGLEGTVTITEASAGEALLDFLRTRLKGEWAGAGRDVDLIEAVLEAGWDDPFEAHVRLEAVQDARNSGILGKLAAPFKRVSNISKKEADEGFDPGGLSTDAERELLRVFGQVEGEVAASLAARNPKQALASLLPLQAPVDALFEAVMIMDPDPEIRRNRLGLLHAISRCFGRLLDFGKVAGE